MHQITDDVLRVIPPRASRRPAMKLYYATGTCSLAPISSPGGRGSLSRSSGSTFEASRTWTETGTDFTGINQKGYVPALRLDRS
jgi:glutathione S-transferase